MFSLFFYYPHKNFSLILSRLSPGFEVQWYDNVR